MPEGPWIIDLLAVPEDSRDLDWLKAALQTVVHLEFATIPPYLCAMWSIKSGEGRAYDHLREVVMEEMLHLGFTCNMLTTIDETPRLFPDAAPSYPTKLPGGVRPNLTVPLRGLTRDGIKDVFMEIEKPQHDISGTDSTDENDPTIGNFYDAILGAFTALPTDTVIGERQLGKKIDIRENVTATLFRIESITDVMKAIKVIKEQGEGTSPSPFESSKEIAYDLAHYFRFAELHTGKELVPDPMTGGIEFTGNDIPFPDTPPMAEVPPGGDQNAPDNVAAKLLEFDQTYTNMLKQLQGAWENGSLSNLNASIYDSMLRLTDLAAEIMTIEITPGGPTYGPCFRIAE